jgi:hypothetical protein
MEGHQVRVCIEHHVLCILGDGLKSKVVLAERSFSQADGLESLV